MSKIQFVEHSIEGYPSRTIANASLADYTIAIGIDPGTPGEILTQKAAKGRYIFVPMTNRSNGLFQLKEIDRLVFRLMEVKPTTINVAGNGIYSFRPAFTQEYIDDQITEFLEMVFTFSKNKPVGIRSGGQTGIDEAGLKAARWLNIPALCLAPKGWMFRDRSGKDIRNEKLFKERFK